MEQFGLPDYYYHPSRTLSYFAAYPLPKIRSSKYHVYVCVWIPGRREIFYSHDIFRNVLEWVRRQPASLSKLAGQQLLQRTRARGSEMPHTLIDFSSFNEIVRAAVQCVHFTPP